MKIMVLKMIKISRLLKVLFGSLILSCLILFSSCHINEVIPNEGSITLSLSKEYIDAINYDEIPSFTFSFEGNLNTIKNVSKPYYTVFSHNEDIILSDALAKLFEEYKEEVIFEVVSVDKMRSRYFTTLVDGKAKNISMVCDNEEVYNEVAYIPLDCGINLTIDYCRFVSEGKTYYTWRYSRSIAMYMYYPIMKIDNNGTTEIVLFTVPNATKIHVTPDLRLKNVLKKDTYFDSSYYTLSYYDPSGNNNLDEMKAFVWDYYEAYLLSERADEFTFTYLNNVFSCVLRDDGYTIKWKYRK